MNEHAVSTVESPDPASHLRTSRRTVLATAAGAAVASLLSLPALAQDSSEGLSDRRKIAFMSRVKTKDGTEIFYKDWGSGPVILFSHGWPLNADAWEDQLFYFASNGYRVVAHDCRGHGRSDQPWQGNDIDTYADDLAAVITALDLRHVTLVGHSSGAGDVTRYIGRHGTERIKKAVLVSAIPPTMLKSAANPGGTPIASFDATRAGVTGDRAQFYRDISAPFFGANRPGAKVSQGIVDAFWGQCMMAGLKGVYDCIRAFSESDFHADLAKFDVPTLIIHGEDDQFVPIDDTARLTVKLVKGATLKTYPGAPHGLPVTHKARFNADLLAFMRA